MYTIDVDTPAISVYGYSILVAIGSGLTYQSGDAITSVKVALKGGFPKDIRGVVSLQNLHR
jgi:hypothetical protein